MNHASPAALAIEEYHFLHAAQAETLPRLPWLLDQLTAWQQEASRPHFLRLLHTDLERNTAQLWSKRFREQARHLIVLGIGGSSLGANMLVNALAPNGLPVTFYDNICPEFLASLYDIEWRDTQILAVSKSGDTAETLAQFLTVLPTMKVQLGSRYNAHAAVITEHPDSTLGRMAQEMDIPIIAHPTVGGRFSVLSVTGLLPAVFAGGDIDTLLTGASAMAKQGLLTQPEDNPALRFAMAQTNWALSGKQISVIMAYGQRLEKITDWFRQLWAESLGKVDPSGRKHGLTPMDARGVTDQHSQLQLYLDGPEDKQFTLLHDPSLATQGHTIPTEFGKLSAVAPLAGHTIGELFTAEFLGTRDALIHRGAPVRTLGFAGDNAYALGQLILLLELETVMVAALLGVNPFDQPAVEESKQRARSYLERYALHLRGN